MTVLIVEDNSSVRRLLRQAVNEIADEIWECGDGTEALPAYAAHRPDVVLMDIRMPNMDGLAAIKRILASDPSARIVMVTDYDDDDLRSAAQAAGACAYVVKLDLSGLAHLVCTIARAKG